MKSQHPDIVAINKRIKETEIKVMECLERNFGLVVIAILENEKGIAVNYAMPFLLPQKGSYSLRE